ncbi:TetR/AcrR family transcriptional regulator [Novosphingobium bradum]|uniref:TetR/AcrR family transcriptional regulator n=1 Tax=Novosphingobium bradum TaxID=1737444 RepID=A0ABV7ILW5_9SPHN
MFDDIASRAAPAPAGQSLKDRLLFAAERVVAQRGFAGATVQEIHRAAATRNASAIHYHYGSLEGLLAAVFQSRTVRLDLATMRRSAEVEGIVAPLVRALAVFLEPRAEGNHYLRFLERALIETRLARTFVPREVMAQWEVAEALLARLLAASLPPRLVSIRLAFARTHFISGLAQVEAWLESGEGNGALLPMLVQAVIDATVAILSAPVTAALAREIAVVDQR